MAESVESSNINVEVKELTPGLQELRAGIINSVLEHGLKPSDQLKEEGKFHMPSKDSDAFYEVEGCIVKPSASYPDPGDFLIDLDNSLYTDERSIFPVMIERRNDFSGLEMFYDQLDTLYQQYPRMTAHERGVAEQRMSASFLVVYRTSNLPGLMENSGMVEAYGVEETGLAPDVIAYLVFPKGIFDEYQRSNLAKDKIVIPTKIISKSIKKKLMWLKQNTFRVPDYESTLRTIVDEIGEPIWVHGVRLPTQEDVLPQLTPPWD